MLQQGASSSPRLIYCICAVPATLNTGTPQLHQSHWLCPPAVGDGIFLNPSPLPTRPSFRAFSSPAVSSSLSP